MDNFLNKGEKSNLQIAVASLDLIKLASGAKMDTSFLASEENIEKHLSFFEEMEKIINAVKNQEIIVGILLGYSVAIALFKESQIDAQVHENGG